MNINILKEFKIFFLKKIVSKRLIISLGGFNCFQIKNINYRKEIEDNFNRKFSKYRLINKNFLNFNLKLYIYYNISKIFFNIDIVL